VTSKPASDALAAVVFEAPHGTEGVLLTPAMAPAVPFGRGGDCPIRFGYAPRLDTGLARRAGAFVIAADRLVIESSPDPSHAPVQVRAPGRTPVELHQGELYAPGVVEFEVVARGTQEWAMTVRVRRPAPAADRRDDPTEPVTERRAPDLTAHERAVLAAYLAPMRAGHLEPATHADVAEALSFSVNKVRGDLYGIWAKMVAHGVPVPAYSDKRMAVTHAAVRNGLVAG
jgi:hypothetical protein